MAPRLVDDLISVVLDSIDNWWTRDLVRLSLLSTKWVGPVRKRLYRCPSLHSFTQIRLLARTLSENPALAALIQGIDLCPEVEQGTETMVREDVIGLMQILNLDGLSSVKLGGVLSIESEKILNAMAHPEAIIRLDINGPTVWGERILPCLEWDEVLACKLSKLQTLRLANLKFDILYSPSPNQRQAPELILDNVILLEAFELGDAYPLWRSLQIISIRGDSSADIISQCIYLLRLSRESIERLELEAEISTCQWIGCVFDRATYPSLRRLSLAGIEVDANAVSAIARACQNLESLSVTGPVVCVTCREWISLLRSGQFPLLRRLSMTKGTNKPPIEQWSACDVLEVTSAASSREISLTLCP